MSLASLPKTAIVRAYISGSIVSTFKVLQKATAPVPLWTSARGSNLPLLPAGHLASKHLPVHARVDKVNALNLCRVCLFRACLAQLKSAGVLRRAMQAESSTDRRCAVEWSAHARRVFKLTGACEAPPDRASGLDAGRRDRLRRARTSDGRARARRVLVRAIQLRARV